MDEMQNYVNQIKALQKQNNSWSAQQAQKQMDFQERMSNTAHVREIADLQAAGLNPVLSAKLGGASTPSGSMAEADTSGSGAIATLFDRMMENNSARELKELTLQHEKELQEQREKHDIEMERMKQEFQLMMKNSQNATQAAKSSGGSGGSGSENKNNSKEKEKDKEPEYGTDEYWKERLDQGLRTDGKGWYSAVNKAIVDGIYALRLKGEIPDKGTSAYKAYERYNGTGGYSGHSHHKGSF